MMKYKYTRIDRYNYDWVNLSHVLTNMPSMLKVGRKVNIIQDYN